MTYPPCMNCAHMDDGWCLTCVKDLWDKWLLAENDASKYWQIVEIVDPDNDPDG